MAGIREYAARGIPIYVLDANESLIRSILAAPHHQYLDSLARAPRAPILRVVRDRTVIGQGPNRIELIPYRTEGLDRMLFALIPEQQIAYTAEGAQLYGTSVFFPQNAIEAVDRIEHVLGKQPARFIGMHVPVTPWETLLKALGR